MKHSDLENLDFAGPWPGLEPLLQPSEASAASYSSDRFHFWDPWFLRVGEELHLFHLQANKGVHPAERHHCSSIGHAILQKNNWKQLAVALEPAKNMRCLWTGSSNFAFERCFLFYTFRKKTENWRQRIGLALSDDLISFEHGELSGATLPDTQFYKDEDEKNEFGVAPAWRDPFIFYDQNAQKYRMLVTAKDTTKQGRFDACIAQVSSEDLRNWKQTDPLLSPGKFAEMEHPQLISWGGKYYLFFSCKGEYCAFADEVDLQFSQPFCYVSDSLGGHFEPFGDFGLVQSIPENLFGMRVLACSESYALAIGWLSGPEDEGFIGEVTAPFLLRRDAEALLYEEIELLCSKHSSTEKDLQI